MIIQKPLAPLNGIQILDLSEVWAGPMAASLLGDLGARVIKVESFPRPSLTRLKGQAIGYSGDDPDSSRPWDRAALHNLANRNKYGITLNIRTPLGMDLLKKLVTTSEVLIESFTSGTSTRLGVDYPAMKTLSPNIVMLSMSGWGEEGPYKRYASLGSALDGFTGHHLMRGYPGTDPSTTSIIQHTDAVAAVGAVFAILTALYYKIRTGKGQWIDMSQVECFLPHLGGAMMEHILNDRMPDPQGNRHPYMSPYGCYRCIGEDNWIVINVTSEEEWMNLCSVANHIEWSTDEMYSDPISRNLNQDSLDDKIQAWTKDHDKFYLMEILQGAGIPAQPVLDDVDLYNNRHLNDRCFFQRMRHPVAGEHLYPGPLWRLTELHETEPIPANTLGQHNDWVYKELLGLSTNEIRSLRDQGVIGEVFPDPDYDAI